MQQVTSFALCEYSSAGGRAERCLRLKGEESEGEGEGVQVLQVLVAVAAPVCTHCNTAVAVGLQKSNAEILALNGDNCTFF